MGQRICAANCSQVMLLLAQGPDLAKCWSRAQVELGIRKTEHLCGLGIKCLQATGQWCGGVCWVDGAQNGHQSWMQSVSSWVGAQLQSGAWVLEW